MNGDRKSAEELLREEIKRRRGPGPCGPSSRWRPAGVSETRSVFSISQRERKYTEKRERRRLEGEEKWGTGGAEMDRVSGF